MSGRQSKRERREQERAEALSRQTGNRVQWVPPELMHPTQDVFVQSKPGEHKWSMIAVYEISADEALDSHAGGDRTPLLDRDHLISMNGPLCLVCEEPWRTVHNKPCTGDPTLTGGARTHA